MVQEADEKFATGSFQYNSACCVADLVPVKLGKLPLPSYLKGFGLLFDDSLTFSNFASETNKNLVGFSSAKCM